MSQFRNVKTCTIVNQKDIYHPQFDIVSSGVLFPSQKIHREDFVMTLWALKQAARRWWSPVCEYALDGRAGRLVRRVHSASTYVTAMRCYISCGSLLSFEYRTSYTEMTVWTHVDNFGYLSLPMLLPWSWTKLDLAGVGDGAEPRHVVAPSWSRILTEFMKTSRTTACPIPSFEYPPSWYTPVLSCSLEIASTSIPSPRNKLVRTVGMSTSEYPLATGRRWRPPARKFSIDVSVTGLLAPRSCRAIPTAS
jgi:hypothetical protein